MVVGAGVMVYGTVVELALKLLSPGNCAFTEFDPPGELYREVFRVSHVVQGISACTSGAAIIRKGYAACRTTEQRQAIAAFARKASAIENVYAEKIGRTVHRRRCI